MVCYSRAVLQKGLRAKGSHREGCLHHKHQSWATCQMLVRMAYRSKSQTARAVRIPPLLCMVLSKLATNSCPQCAVPRAASVPVFFDSVLVCLRAGVRDMRGCW